jgi:hypothetical protein
MANPMKAIKAVKNFTGGKKGRAIENKVRKEFGMGKGTNTTGKIKAIKRNARVKDSMNPITKGKNKNFVKDANKKTLPSASKSRRASIKEASFNSRMEKHPLVRNTGQSSAESKYRLNRGKPISVKRRGK